MIVYRILNKLTGQSYIGQTSRTLAERITNHINGKSAIGKDIAKYGRQNFDVSVLDVTDDKEKADKAERYWIAFYDTVINGYNVLAGGTPTNKEMQMLSQMGNSVPRKPRKKKRDIKPIQRFDAEEAKRWRASHYTNERVLAAEVSYVKR